MDLLENVHIGLSEPDVSGDIVTIQGNYKYFHYVCDKVKDQGYGCGYRTLQSICSWILLNQLVPNVHEKTVPSICDIQKLLVELDDKPNSFIGSRGWIGSFEACLVLDDLYNISSKIIHLHQGKEINKHMNELSEHFKSGGGLLFMGGLTDCSAKGIAGVAIAKNEDESNYLLVIDPHFVGKSRSVTELQELNWIKWLPVGNLDNSFYNICVPQCFIYAN